MRGDVTFDPCNLGGGGKITFFSKLVGLCLMGEGTVILGEPELFNAENVYDMTCIGSGISF